MRPITVRTTVDGTVADVFAFVSDFENNPRWQRGMRSCRWTSPPPHGVGATYDQVARFLGRDIVSSFVVVEHEPDHRVRITSTAGPFPITETRIVEPAGDEGDGDGDEEAAVTAVVEGDASGFFRYAGPFLRPMVARSVRRDYARLSRLLAR